MRIEIKAHLTKEEEKYIKSTVNDITRRASYRDSLVSELLAHCIANKEIYDAAKSRFKGIMFDCPAGVTPLLPLYEIFTSPHLVDDVMNTLKEKAYVKWFGKKADVYKHILHIKNEQPDDYAKWYIEARLDVIMTQILNRL